MEIDNYGIVLYGNGVDYAVSYNGNEIIAKLRGRLLYTTKRSHHPVCPGDHVKLISTSKNDKEDNLNSSKKKKKKDKAKKSNKKKKEISALFNDENIIELKDENGNKLTFFIDKILPRKNKISRPSNYQIRKEQVLIANIDKLYIIASVFSPRLNSAFLDRLLVFSDKQQLKTSIIINKIDLGITESEKEIINDYKKLGFEVIETSVKEKINIELLNNRTKNTISAFIGNSGVGKSSILNSIDESINQKVGSTSEYSLKGKHTTKQARLFTLKNGGYLIDTPGIREFGLWDIDYEDLKEYFPEFLKYREKCKYSNCLHQNEPICGIKDAVDDGKIPFFRYENYLKMYDSLFENKEIYFKKE